MLIALQAVLRGTRDTVKALPARYLAPATALTLSCASSTQFPCDLYRERHYIEAADVFEQSETELSTLPVPERAEYGLYRGMTFLALGDLSNAHRWLRYAASLQRYSTAALDSEEQQLLRRGWQQLDSSLRKWAAPQETTSSATALGAPADHPDSQPPSTEPTPPISH